MALRTLTHPTWLVLLVAAVPPAASQGVGPTPPAAPFHDEIVVTATGFAATTDDIPAPTTVVTREEIEDALTENVSDVLARVPGMTVLRTGDEGKQTSLFTRGTNSNQTLVLFDGVRLNSPYLGGFDASLLGTAGIERIEVARGPYSALWGADAIGGVVNVIPQRGRDATELGFFGEGGEHGWERYQGEAVLGGEHLGLYVAGLYRSGDGELDNSDFTTDQLLLDAGWTIGKRGSRLAVVAQDLEVETGVPFSSPGTPTPDRRQRTEQQLLAVPLRWALSDGWTLELMGSEVEREFSFSDPDDPFGLTSTTTAADTTEARLASHHSFGRHTFTWGGEWREDVVSDASNLGINLADHTSEVTSAFLQDVVQAGGRLRLILGVRWDDTDAWGDEISPRVNLGWRLSDGFELRLGYGEAFRQPSLGELYFPMFGNPNLSPETSASYELDLAYSRPGQSSRWQINLFATELDDLIQFDYLSFTNQNIGSAEILGVELAIESELTNSSRQLVQVTWLDAADDAGQALLRRPEWSGAYTLSGLLWYRVRGDLALVYVGSRDDVDPITFERARISDHYTIDLALAWQAWESVELTLRVVNLTDEEYQEVLGYPAPSRRFMGGLRIRL